MFKKAFSILLTVAILLSSSTVAMADTTTENDSLQSEITLQVASSWVVTVPDSIVIDDTKTATYSTSLSGDVAKATSISVIPDSNIVLSDGVREIAATVTQEKQQWMGTEITEEGVTTTGTISVTDDVPAGTWTGTLNFVVSCSENTFKFDSFMTESGYDLEDYTYQAVYSRYKGGELVFTRKIYSDLPLTLKASGSDSMTYSYLVNSHSYWSTIEYAYLSDNPLLICEVAADGTYSVIEGGGVLLYETATDTSVAEKYAGSGLLYSNHDILHNETEDIFYAKTE